LRKKSSSWAYILRQDRIETVFTRHSRRRYRLSCIECVLFLSAITRSKQGRIRSSIQKFTVKINSFLSLLFLYLSVNTIPISIKTLIFVRYLASFAWQCTLTMLDGIELVSFVMFPVAKQFLTFNKITILFCLDQICEVFYIDYGNMEELPIEFIHEILPDFARLPARSIACTISEVISCFFFVLLKENRNLRFYHRLDKKVGRNERPIRLLNVVVMNEYKQLLLIRSVLNGLCILFNFVCRKLKKYEYISISFN